MVTRGARRSHAPMPSVVMKRSMRIFGACRALRSGTGFWPARSGQNYHKVSAAATEPQDWIHLLDNSGGDKGDDLRLDFSESTPDVVTPMDIDDDKILSARSDRKLSIRGVDSNNVGRYALVYHRKRKTSDLSDLMFGKKYYRKRCRKLKKAEIEISFSLIAQSVDGDRSGWLACFLNLILRYMAENAADFRLSRLSSLLLTEPLSLVLSSHGIAFSWVPSWATRSGLCKIYESRTRSFTTPLFTLEFSALPSCFMYFHYGLLLNYHLQPQSNFLSDLTLLNGDSSNTDLTVEPEPTPKLLDPVLVVNKFNRTRTKTNGRKSRVHAKPVLVGTRRSQRSRPLLDFEDFDPNRCRANVLVFENGESYKVDGAVIGLEMSSLRKWSITVTKNSLFQTNFHPLKSIEPYSIDSVTKHITWRDSRFDWMLEFVNKKYWSKFSNLHKEGFHRNSLSPAEVNVPVFREIEDYVDYETNVPFARTELYARVKDDEVTRIMGRKTAIYEMDSDDEKWLENFNSECFVVNEHHEKLSLEDFESTIDAAELNLARNPGDKDASNLYVNLGNKDIIDAVYGYWIRKRKKNNSTLRRIYKMYQPGRDRLHIIRVMRKKRTSETRRRGNKLFWKNFGMNPHEVEEEERALQKCEQRKATASLLETQAVEKRKTAQMLMENADLAALKAMVALRIAEEANNLESVDAAVSLFLHSD